MKFKSDRAARQAFTKAEKAYKAARSERSKFEDQNDTRVCVEDSDVGEWADEARATLAKYAELKKAEDDANDAAIAIYSAAQEQGIFIDSYRLGYSGTKDLISANAD